ncbi:hypothetical protein SAY87_018707 [Trapa incisa]|uniref:Uncharacterized protein n=1 Tax=Trapa incisa TaxID=236973 RepID=A0AAN7K0C1_9MYRT|nr:hypothetical protein SAY87_018707 [Trapa incisa]
MFSYKGGSALHSMRLKLCPQSLHSKHIPMVEFPPNLDDGELWLPSGIFLNDAVANRGRGLIPARCFSSLDQLPQSLAALTKLPPRSLISLYQTTQHGAVITPSARGLLRSAMTSSSAVNYEHLLLQQALLTRNRLENHLNICYGGEGATRREYRGTGVFLPRIAEYATASDYRKKQGMRNRLDIRIREHMNFTMVGAVAKKEKEGHLEMPAEMSLPHEWPY